MAKLTLKQRYKHIIDWFLENKGVQETELAYENDFQLLVAVILSAQCTDKRVNIVTPTLFAKYPDARSMAKASYEEVFEQIKSISYPNSKSRYLVDMSRSLIEDFGGRVPESTDEMQRLAGVGRKTANVVASVLYSQPKMAVDTHVFRVARRLGLSKGKNPLQVETDLTNNIPKKYISIAHQWLILHGRYVCQARKPKCEECGVSRWCEHFGN
ncbi:endonuclease III [Porphyromonadaceae bacterium COT-184 OH4590]|nr:endonuclease III [Porphyromonadaceae bacterium COT-184 OH4590]